MSLEELVAEREIYRQLIKFARAMDNRDWKAISAIMADSIKADFGTGEVQGSAAVIDFIRSFLDGCGTTQHLLGNIIIEVAGDSATSRSYVSDMHLGKDTKSDISFRTLGDYCDEWKKTDGAWLMIKRVKDNRASLGSLDVFKS